MPSIVTPPQSPLADVTAAHSGSRRFLRLLVFASLIVADFAGCSFLQSTVAVVELAGLLCAPAAAAMNPQQVLSCLVGE